MSFIKFVFSFSWRCKAEKIAGATVGSSLECFTTNNTTQHKTTRVLHDTRRGTSTVLLLCRTVQYCTQVLCLSIYWGNFNCVSSDLKLLTGKLFCECKLLSDFFTGVLFSEKKFQRGNHLVQENKVNKEERKEYFYKIN